MRLSAVRASFPHASGGLHPHVWAGRNPEAVSMSAAIGHPGCPTEAFGHDDRVGVAPQAFGHDCRTGHIRSGRFRQRAGKERTMSQVNELPEEESLDPESWDDMRALGHRMVDDIVTYLGRARAARVAARPRGGEGAPQGAAARRAAGARRGVRGFPRDVLPYPMGNIHPRFWGWVMGNGTVAGRPGRYARRRHEPQPGRRRTRGRSTWRPRCSTGQGDDRLPARGQRAAGERRLDGQPRGPGRGAQRQGRLRRAAPGAAAARRG